MAYSTTFYLKEPKSKNDTLVMMLFTFNHVYYRDGLKKYGRVRFSTGEKINPNHWNYDQHRAKQIAAFPYGEFNTTLSRYKNTVENIYRKFLNDGAKDITPELIRYELDITYGRGVRTAPLSFMAFTDRFIATVRQTGKGKPINELTIKKYRNTYNILKDFAAYRNASFDYKDIDKQFYEDFLSYMQTKRKFSLNTCGKVVKMLKLFLKQAVESGVDYDLRKLEKFAAPTVETDKVYLTVDEIERIRALDLGNTTLGRMRDLFVCACFTGLRYSDLNALKKENIIQIEGENYLQVRAFKTNGVVTLPLHPTVKEIFERRDYYLSNAVTNQTMNKLIKEMCKKAKINQIVCISENIAGKDVSRNCEKWEMVSTHTARRSFATNAYLSGIAAQSIMMLTGHKTEKAFKAYLRFDSEANAVLMKNSGFFQGKNQSLRVAN